MVNQMIRISSQTLQCSIYQMSRFTRPSICHSSFVSPRKPVTCAHPVRPGFTKCRTIYWSINAEYCSVCANMCGRGPTKLISPFKTFRNCGNSSMFDLRIKLPNGNFLGSSFVACNLSESLFTCMERNFSIMNVLPSRPVLACLKKLENIFF